MFISKEKLKEMIDSSVHDVIFKHKKETNSILTDQESFLQRSIDRLEANQEDSIQETIARLEAWRKEQSDKLEKTINDMESWRKDMNIQLNSNRSEDIAWREEVRAESLAHSLQIERGLRVIEESMEVIKGLVK